MPNRLLDTVQRLLEEESIPPEVAERLRGKIQALINRELRDRGGGIQALLALLSDRLIAIRKRVDEEFFTDRD